MDNGCTLDQGGNICDTGLFTLPSETRLADITILGFVINCADLGSGIDFEIDLRVNGTSVRTYTVGVTTSRGMWELLEGNVLDLNNNLIELVAGTPNLGSCEISDMVLTYRMTSVQ